MSDTTPTLNVLRVPMPAPTSNNSPKFDGNNLRDFLASLAQHGTNTGITNKDLLVSYILSYSAPSVKAIIRNMEEFDVNMDNATGLNWKDATAQLTLLYGQRNHIPDYSIAQLKKFIEDHSTTSSFTDKADISDYYRDFLRISAPLLKKQKITKEESQFYFIAGIPKRLKDWFTGEVPSGKRTCADPPTIAQSIKILYKCFDEESISYEPWNNRVETNVLDEATQPSEPTEAKSPAGNDVKKTNLDIIMQCLEELSLNLARLNSQQAEQHKCFMCFKVGTHPLGLRHFPETCSLLDENLIKFDTNNQRYVLMNGTDLPRTPNGFRGGIAAYICSQREMARASVAGLTYGDKPVIGPWLDTRNFACF
jgi:hypothetical protein